MAISEVPINHSIRVEDYAVEPALTGAVMELQATAGRIAPGMRDRTVVMVNSTEGGGVAEMMPRLAALLNELGSARAGWSSAPTGRGAPS